jgi:hypothetical protein
VCSRLADPLLVFADCGVAIRETYNTLERFAQPYAKARLLIGHSHSFQAVKRILLFGLYWNGPQEPTRGIYSGIERIITCTGIGGISENDITYCKVLFFNDVPTIYTGRR